MIFESSDRGDSLVERDFQFGNNDIHDSRGFAIPVQGYFMPKSAMEAGLEVADLVAHTAGRQERKRLRGDDDFAMDFKNVFQRSATPDLVEYISIASIEG